MTGVARLKGIASTPATRIIPDEELPYEEHPTSYDKELVPPSHVHSNYDSPSVDGISTSPSGIAIEELPADRIDSVMFGSGNIFKAFWDYLKLYWRS